MKKILRIIVILAIAIAAGWFFYARANNRSAVSKDGVIIVYSVYGKGDPTLVFVHGWCGSRDVWHKQVPYFAKKYRVITLDLAGHGASGRQRKIYTQEAYGEDVAAVVKAAGAGKVMLIGHSMSGTVILEANRLLKDKVAGLIAIDTLENFEDFPASEENRKTYLEPLKKDFAGNCAPFMTAMFNKNADPGLVKEVVKNVSRSDPRIAMSTMECYFDTPIIPLLSDVKAPLWCLNSDLWQNYPEINSKYLKNYHLRKMRGVGHFLMVESPDEFNRQLDDIVKRIEKNEQ